MKYGGNPICSYCCTDEHERCLGVWATQDQRFWFECGCERCEAAACAAWDGERLRTIPSPEVIEEKPRRVITFKVSEEARAVLGLDAIDAKRAKSKEVF